MPVVKLAKGLLTLSSAVFGVTGLMYLVGPGVMLSVVGIRSGATNDFLLRTEGVVLLCAAGFLWAARVGSPSQLRLVLLTLSGFYLLGSLVDLAAFAQGVVGTASVPSAAVRIVIGSVCLLAAERVRGPH
jgi:hypothetical protein